MEKLGSPIYMDKTAREFNETYLPLAGLHRDDIYLTNTVKCRKESGKLSPAEILSCAGHHLPDEIEAANPEFIVLMGAVACSLVPKISLDVEHGIPTQASIFDVWTGTIIPMDHPSGGMRDTSMMIPLLEDFERLGKVIRGEWKPPVAATLPTDYRYAEEYNDIRLSFVDAGYTDKNKCEVAIDMETHAGEPFSVQWSTEPGKAFMLRQTPADEVTKRLTGDVSMSNAEYLSVCLEHFTDLSIFHQAGGDLDILNQVGISTPPRIRDTMQEAYHLGNLPQGLKALAYRLLGIRMKSWIEVVGPPSRNAVLDWIVAAIEYAETNLQIVTEKQLKTKLKIIHKPSPLEKRLRAILRYGCFNDEYPIWKHLDELEAATNKLQWDELTQSIGYVPQLGIANCTPEDALEYACKDADVTRRLAPILEEMRKAKALKVNPSDWDFPPV